MQFLLDQKKKKWLLRAAVAVIILSIVFAACGLYVNDYYHADGVAIEAFGHTDGISKRKIGDNATAYEPERAEAGFIFYPGGKVEHTAYEPLMLACAKKGILCILVEMPFRLAVLDMAAADGLQGYYPDVDSWYIGGHSLGGSMAASYVAKHASAFDGLVLLAAYSTDTLTKTDLNVLSVYGTEDKVMNRDKYAQYKSNLPKDFEEYVIDGGCHAYFGMYGKQAGDGEAKINAKKQILLTADAIEKTIKR